MLWEVYSQSQFKSRPCGQKWKCIYPSFIRGVFNSVSGAEHRHGAIAPQSQSEKKKYLENRGKGNKLIKINHNALCSLQMSQNWWVFPYPKFSQSPPPPKNSGHAPVKANVLNFQLMTWLRVHVMRRDWIVSASQQMMWDMALSWPHNFTIPPPIDLSLSQVAAEWYSTCLSICMRTACANSTYIKPKTLRVFDKTFNIFKTIFGSTSNLNGFGIFILFYRCLAC